jgi:hypothetical protein
MHFLVYRDDSSVSTSHMLNMRSAGRGPCDKPPGTHPKHFANLQFLMGTAASHTHIALQNVSHTVTVSEFCSLHFALYNKYH